MDKFAVTTFYKFINIPARDLPALKARLTESALKNGIKGLLLIGTEGCNATIAGSPEGLSSYKNILQADPLIGELVFKDSLSSRMPFRRFKADIRQEIVTIKQEDAIPGSPVNNHLSPAEWNAVLKSGEDVVLLDTRNVYETEIGIFRGATDMNLRKFSEFPDKVRDLGIPRDKKVLMYCTGGIRCEKAIIDMQKEGYRNVFQLEGGILKYLEEFPGDLYEGECFVFDHRVAVDQNLKPSSQYKLCPHCGNPAKEKISCLKCSVPAIVCHHCLKQGDKRHTCSKNCAHHYGLQMLRAG